jgi:hypothetical protein
MARHERSQAGNAPERIFARKAFLQSHLLVAVMRGCAALDFDIHSITG